MQAAHARVRASVDEQEQGIAGASRRPVRVRRGGEADGGGDRGQGAAAVDDQRQLPRQGMLRFHRRADGRRRRKGRRNEV